MGGRGSGAMDIEGISKRLVPWLIQHRRRVLAAAAALSVVGTFLSVLLYRDLRTDVEELLPADAPSVVAAHTVAAKLHGMTHLTVVFEGQDGDALERLADDLAARLQKLPKELAATVEYRVDEERAFFQRNGALYLDTKDLQSVVDRVSARIAWEKRRANPLFHLVEEEEEEKPAPSLDFSDLEAKYAGAVGALSRFRNGYFQTPDGHILAVRVRPPELDSSFARNRRLLDAVRAEVEALSPKTYDSTVKTGYYGDVVSLVEEQESLASDLVSSTVAVLVLVVLALWFFFRRWRAIGSILLSLAAGCAVTFGLAELAVGHLNANTAFLGSIVVGNGINVSIVFVARYLEERRTGVEAHEAIRRAWAGTFTATFAAAFAAALAYLALASTAFRGFSQFGLIGWLGMALCWVASYLLLPPLLAIIDAPAALPPRTGKHTFGGLVTNLVLRHPRAAQIGTALVTLVTVVGLAMHDGGLIEYDLSRLRSAKTLKSGAVYWSTRGDQIFQAYLSPIAVLAETPEDLQKVTEAIARRRAAQGKDDVIREVRTLSSILPEQQEEKLALVARLRALLPESRLARLDPQTRARVEKLLPPADLQPVQLTDVPLTLRRLLEERDGTTGRIALVFPNVRVTLPPQDLARITNTLRGAIADAGGRAQAVGQSLIFNDIGEAIVRDGPQVSLLAFALVALLVMAVLHKVRPTLEVLGSLLIGVFWLVGLAALARVRLNFLNFVVFPITFGIGVDYSVNVIQRLRIEGRGALERVLRETGGAVALCSLTTIIGYASLLVADNRALAGFGLLASVGEVACLGAALIGLPVWLLRPRASDEGAENAPESAVDA